MNATKNSQQNTPYINTIYTWLSTGWAKKVTLLIVAITLSTYNWFS